MTIEEHVLGDLGIIRREADDKKFRAPCPKCRDTRRPARKKARCLSVTVTEWEVRFKCYNVSCLWEGSQPLIPGESLGQA